MSPVAAPPERFLITCRPCGYESTETSEIAAAAHVMMHKLRCVCSTPHVCVRPAALRWTVLGDLATVTTGPCLDAPRCDECVWPG